MKNMKITREKAVNVYDKYVQSVVAVLSSIILLACLAVNVVEVIARGYTESTFSPFDMVIEFLYYGESRFGVFSAILSIVMLLISLAGIVTVAVSICKIVGSFNRYKTEKTSYSGIIIANLVLTIMFFVLGLIIYVVANLNFSGYGSDGFGLGTDIFTPMILSVVLMVTMAIIKAVVTNIPDENDCNPVQHSNAASIMPQDNSINSIKNDLTTIKDLFDTGIIDEKEYAEMKAKIIAENSTDNNQSI